MAGLNQWGKVKTTTDRTVAVFYPASDPNETSVGGTSLFLQPDQTRASETAWEFSGGGVSTLFTQPNWQTGPGVPANLMRDVADVAFDADPNTGYYVFLSYHPNFYDIKFGNNGGGIPGGFNAGPNWDHPTGWGTPKGNNVVKSMKGFFGP